MLFGWVWILTSLGITSSALSLGCGPLEASRLASGSESSTGCGTPSTDPEALRDPARLPSGRSIILEGAVTGARSQPRAGFYLQAETAATTSALGGIFVVTSSADLPEPGARVRVRGQLGRTSGQPELTTLELLSRCGRSTLEPEPLDLLSSDPAELWDQRWVRARANWTVTDTTQVASNGTLTLSTGGRAYAEGHDLGKSAASNPSHTWTLEGVDVALEAWLEMGTASEHLRLGAQSGELRAVVLSTREHRLLASGPPELHAAVPSPPPAASPGSLRVAALNLDNYFVELGARGAQTVLELSRQRDKLSALLAALNADILALSELQNQGDASLSDLISALNVRVGSDRSYRFENTGDPGADALRTGIAYRPSRVTAAGPARFADPSEFRRPPLLQAFEAGSLRFTLGVVHLKSKRCDAGPELVGPEGCGAEARAREVDALLSTIAALPDSPDRVLLAGDFNSDTLEAPSLALGRAGFVDLLDSVGVSERYSYAFDGQLSQLDHAFATAALTPSLVRAAIWHIDADEPRLFGYELENPPNAYGPDARRASDHDPVLVDLSVR